jgi:hypothetical protein
MGCTSNRDSSQFIEQDTFSQVERSLGFSHISCFSIDSTLYRFAKDSKLSKPQLQACFQSLSIDFEHHSTFFNYFLQDNNYDAGKLSLLGVLLGKGTEDDKLRVLFQNYDIDCSKSLDFCEINALVNDLLEISCLFVPMYVDTLHGKKENVSEYCMHIRLSYKSYQDEIVDMIIGNNDSVDEKSFYLKIKNSKKLISLLNSHKIRKMVHKAFKRVVVPIAYVDYFIERGELNKLIDPDTRG